MCYYITVADLGNCNAVVAERQTHHLEGVAGRPVWVQIPPTAPNEKINASRIFVKRFLFVRAAEFFCVIYCL